MEALKELARLEQRSDDIRTVFSASFNRTPSGWACRLWFHEKDREHSVCGKSPVGGVWGAVRAFLKAWRAARTWSEYGTL